MSRMWKTIPTTIAPDATFTHPRQRETIRVRVLWTDVSTTSHPQSASAHTLGWEAVRMSRVRETLSAEGYSQPARPHTPRRAKPPGGGHSRGLSNTRSLMMVLIVRNYFFFLVVNFQDHTQADLNNAWCGRGRLEWSAACFPHFHHAH